MRGARPRPSRRRHSSSVRPAFHARERRGIGRAIHAGQVVDHFRRLQVAGQVRIGVGHVEFRHGHVRAAAEDRPEIPADEPGRAGDQDGFHDSSGLCIDPLPIRVHPRFTLLSNKSIRNQQMNADHSLQARPGPPAVS